MPDRPGIITSSRTRSGGWSRAASSAETPSSTAVTSKPAASSLNSTSSRMSSSSSATRIAVILYFLCPVFSTLGSRARPRAAFAGTGVLNAVDAAAGAADHPPFAPVRAVPPAADRPCVDVVADPRVALLPPALELGQVRGEAVDQRRRPGQLHGHLAAPGRQFLDGDDLLARWPVDAVPAQQPVRLALVHLHGETRAGEVPAVDILG